jgi:hypothetical protein
MYFRPEKPAFDQVARENYALNFVPRTSEIALINSVTEIGFVIKWLAPNLSTSSMSFLSKDVV